MSILYYVNMSYKGGVSSEKVCLIKTIYGHGATAYETGVPNA